MEVLPLEIRRGILLSLSDLRSLAKAALSCHSLYLALIHNKNRAFCQVLENHMGSDVLSEAIFTWKCAHIPLHPPLTTCFTWSWQTATSIEKTYFYISELAQRFVQFCADSPDIDLKTSLEATPLSNSERTRITLSIYRFEAFANFHRSEPLKKMEHMRFIVTGYYFLARLAPWELTQLAVIHDCFAKQAVPFFSWFVTTHGNLWGNSRDDPCYDMMAATSQYLLSCGVEMLYEAVVVEAYEYLASVVPDDDPEPLPRENWVFLNRFLSGLRGTTTTGLAGTTRGTLGGTTVVHLGDEFDENLVQHLQKEEPSYDDPDNGPKRLWVQSRQDAILGVYEGREWSRRQWGYVLWDEVRLQALGVL